MELLLKHRANVNQVIGGEIALDTADHDGVAVTLRASGGLSGIPLVCMRVYTIVGAVSL